MIAALGSLELVIPWYCYYILVKVCHFRCASIIIHYVNDSLHYHSYYKWFISHLHVRERG